MPITEKPGDRPKPTPIAPKRADNMKSEMLCNGEEIASYLGIDKKSIRSLKKEYGLPVWQMNGVSGPWKAVRGHLDAWVYKMAAIRLQDNYGQITQIMDGET